MRRSISFVLLGTAPSLLLGCSSLDRATDVLDEFQSAQVELAQKKADRILRSLVLKVEGEVTVEAIALNSPDLPLLVVLGWYLLVLFAKDAAASSAGVSAAVIAST